MHPMGTVFSLAAAAWAKLGYSGFWPSALRVNNEGNLMSKKVAYVTGGMGGIGTAICQRLHKDGFTVIAGCGPTRDYAKWLAEQKA